MLVHAVPRLGLRHAAAPRLTLHAVRPAAFVRQQVTDSGRPQVDFAAHILTVCLQGPGSACALRASFITPAAQRRYAACVDAALQGQRVSISARVLATASGSLHVTGGGTVVVVVVPRRTVVVVVPPPAGNTTTVPTIPKISCGVQW